MTDLLEELRAADPAAGPIPQLRLEAVVERYPVSVAGTRARSWLRPALAVAAVAVFLAGTALGVRRSGPQNRLVGADSVIPPASLREAMAIAPPAQRAALADGVITPGELQAAGQAMARCMADRGSGAPSEWIEIGTAQVPVKLDGLDDECERDHMRWVLWGYKALEVERIWGDATVSVYMNPDATDEQLALVRSEIERVAPAAAVHYVDKEAALAEIGQLFPDVLHVQAADVPTSFKLGGDIPADLWETVKTLPGVSLVRLRPNSFEAPPGNEVYLPDDPVGSMSPVTTVVTPVKRGG